MKNKKNIKKIIIIIGIIILPLLYSLFYLKGFWDPYNKLDKIPVALVNLDNCEGKNCKGEEFVQELKEKNTFKFDIVDEQKADNGLINKKYYAVLKIPKNFTKSFNSINNKEKIQPTLTYSPNTKTSYLASQIIGSAVKQIQAELNSNITSEITSNLSNKLYDMPNQTEKINEAITKINKGSEKIKSGSTTLATNTKKLENNYTKFNEGISKVNKGSNTLYNNYQTLDNGINDLYKGVSTLNEKTRNLKDLQTAINTLKEGSNNIIINYDTYKSNSDQQINNAEIAYQNIKSYINNHPEAISDQNLQIAYTIANTYLEEDQAGQTGLSKIKNASQAIKEGQTNINNGINKLSNETKDINKLNDNIIKLQNGLNNLKEGSNKTLNGIYSLKKGTNELSNSSSKLKTGINKINNGTNELAKGTNELNTGINKTNKELTNKIKDSKKETEKLKNLNNYSKKPVKVEEKNYGNVKQYGTYFSPYFMSLSLWVGGILILMGLYYDPEKRFKILGIESKNKYLRLIYYGVIGIAQAMVLAISLKLSLGFEVTNKLLYFGSCILISESFLAIITFLFYSFKDVGKFLAVVFLVLQLSACGGTFPLETEPKFYQIISKFMPMTYSVNLLRESFVTINKTMLTKNIIILSIILVVFTMLILIKEKTKKNECK